MVDEISFPIVGMGCHDDVHISQHAVGRDGAGFNRGMGDSYFFDLDLDAYRIREKIQAVGIFAHAQGICIYISFALIADKPQERMDMERRRKPEQASSSAVYFQWTHDYIVDCIWNLDQRYNGLFARIIHWKKSFVQVVTQKNLGRHHWRNCIECGVDQFVCSSDMESVL